MLMQQQFIPAKLLLSRRLLGTALGIVIWNTVLISSAIRIAQCMGLDKQREISVEMSWDCKVKREVVKRVWAQLCIQDYFSVAFANTYSTLIFILLHFRRLIPTFPAIHPNQFCTPLPSNCDDETLDEQPVEHQTTSSYCLTLARS